MSKRTFAVIAKEPTAGLAKTRLAAQTSPDWAAAAARAFLADTVERFGDAGDERVLLFAPPEAEGFFRELGGGRWRTVPQGGGDLGERFQRFFQACFDEGPGRVVAIAADSPSLPAEWVDQAFGLLAGRDVVIGPATDGGYYLIGLSRMAPVFQGIPWSGPEVLRRTVECLADPGWRLGLLPVFYDVDNLDDWHMLQGHIAAMRRAGVDPGLRNISALPPFPE